MDPPVKSSGGGWSTKAIHYKQLGTHTKSTKLSISPFTVLSITNLVTTAMATAAAAFSAGTNDEDYPEEYQQTIKKYRELVETLPKSESWLGENQYCYQGFWFSDKFPLQGLLLLQNHFKPRPSDIFVATHPKSGTQWLRALTFSVVNRPPFHDGDVDFNNNHPLLHNAPRDLVPLIDVYIYRHLLTSNLETLPSPRLFSTHIPFSCLPESIKGINTTQKIVYISRNPKDVFVSMLFFFNKFRPKELAPLSLEEAFELFCDGVLAYGPYWDHVLGYWKASLESPNKVLFLKYEDLKREPLVGVKRLGEFVGRPFSPEEERRGVVEEIIKLCSFENLSSLEVNKTPGQSATYLFGKNNDFYRMGRVGDWANHLTREMAERLDRITEEKFRGSGLCFDESFVAA